MTSQERLLQAAKSGSTAVLIQLIKDLQEELKDLKAKTEKELSVDEKVEKISIKLASKLATLEKGDKGDEPSDERLDERIKPLIPDPIKGDKGEKGDKGDKGDKGEKGDTGRGKDGRDGKDGIDGKDGSPDTSKQVRYKLESLTGNDRLDISAIKGLNEAIKSIPERPTTTIFGPGKTKIVRVDLSSQLNGVLKTFFLGTHYGIVDVIGSSAPFIFRETVDYNELGKNIVFTNAVDAAVSLATGQTLIVKVLR